MLYHVPTTKTWYLVILFSHLFNIRIQYVGMIIPVVIRVCKFLFRQKAHEHLFTMWIAMKLHFYFLLVIPDMNEFIGHEGVALEEDTVTLTVKEDFTNTFLIVTAFHFLHTSIIVIDFFSISDIA